MERDSPRRVSPLPEGQGRALVEAERVAAATGVPFPASRWSAPYGATAPPCRYQADRARCPCLGARPLRLEAPPSAEIARRVAGLRERRRSLSRRRASSGSSRLPSTGRLEPSCAVRCSAPCGLRSTSWFRTQEVTVSRPGRYVRVLFAYGVSPCASRLGLVPPDRLGLRWCLQVALRRLAAAEFATALGLRVDLCAQQER